MPMILDMFKPGCRVDIRILQQLKREQETGKIAQIFKSRVCDVKEDGIIQLLMPMNGSRYILLPLDFRYEFVFYTEHGLYRCEGEVTERFKSNNIYMNNIRILTQPSKYQRREYYRYDCLMDLNYVELPQEIASLNDVEKVQQEIAKRSLEEKTGFVLDISGGGIRFISQTPCESGSSVFLWIALSKENDQKKDYRLIGNVLQSERIDQEREKYQNRVEFIIKDMKIREDIIKFIFEEERKNRKKNG
ncbi:MAG: flagellar brake protein [Lachnospiraceae bacterium]